MPLRLPVSVSREPLRIARQVPQSKAFSAKSKSLELHSRSISAYFFPTHPISRSSISRPTLRTAFPNRSMSSSTSTQDSATATSPGSTTTATNSATVPNPTAGPLEQSIYTKIMTSLNPTSLKIINDSHKHAHHAAMASVATPVKERETHFRVEIVSEAFHGQRQPARHRVVYALAAEEMAMEGGIHALQISARTPEEDERRKAAS